MKAPNRLLYLFFLFKREKWTIVNERCFLFFSLMRAFSLSLSICAIGRWNYVIYYFVYHYLGHRNHYRHRLIWLSTLDICSKQYMVRPTVEAVMRPIIECQSWQKYQSLAPYAIQPMHENGPIYFCMDLYRNGVARNHPVFVEFIKIENKMRERKKWKNLLHKKKYNMDRSVIHMQQEIFVIDLFQLSFFAVLFEKKNLVLQRIHHRTNLPDVSIGNSDFNPIKIRNNYTTSI